MEKQAKINPTEHNGENEFENTVTDILTKVLKSCILQTAEQQTYFKLNEDIFRNCLLQEFHNERGLKFFSIEFDEDFYTLDLYVMFFGEAKRIFEKIECVGFDVKVHCPANSDGMTISDINNFSEYEIELYTTLQVPKTEFCAEILEDIKKFFFNELMYFTLKFP